ncbi:MAG: bifunctional uridylyltransferase/uridylyl-removing protein, partial [Bauldia sp.]
MNKAVAVSDAPVDGEPLRDRLMRVAGKGGGDLAAKARAAVVATLKQALAEGRAEAEQHLRMDGKGTLCARRLSDVQDSIVAAIYGLAVDQVYRTANPTAAERMAV